ncbi:bifunctional diguanylate cyclase/phosphodiesterase [Sphingomonas gilva]|uniref:Bifunctional diguanylate cyclase/phosphodiesterase n=1 Tax=Sphingomonas gilva TaxID=2305907 RepID=A0A396RPS6_9SPHN|nr:bifunctional diguanylate cyclase/phosphodiesterase [Sphingomonas gilva]RHW17272.1 bifunctional diguanylate cyclase/phosphodiesterase [Sphingomonas gilva]
MMVQAARPETTVFVAPARQLVPAGEGVRLVSAAGDTPLDQQFLASRARAVVADLRVSGGREALAVLAPAILGQHAALLAIVGPDDVAGLHAAREAGATHLLVAPFAPSTLAATLAGLAETGRKLAGDWSMEPLAPPDPADQRRAATRDLVTGARDALAARRWLDRRLSSGEGEGVLVLLVALSRFEMVNTAYGRTAGDTVLRGVAARIEHVAAEVLGDDWLVARMGGSEFAVLGRQAEHPERVTLLAEQIAEAVARPFVSSGAIVALGARIGVAVGEAGERDAARLLRRAGEALETARESDGATVRYASRTTEPAPYDLAIDLRHAIERGEIELRFQPQVAIGGGEISGVEALARWSHPVLGLLGAETLFAAAERADLVLALSDHVQRATLQAAAAWTGARAGLRLAINLTANDIRRPGFADLFIDRVDSSGFPRGRLTVEITEGGLIEDLSLAANLFARFRATGIRVAIDDFGTGYSNLAYLKSLPLDYLKIDKRMAQDIAGTARDRVVVRGVIDMARSLGLAVIAEGVETAEQLDLLAREGCNFYQGYLCAEPLTDAALADLLEERGG